MTGLSHLSPNPWDMGEIIRAQAWDDITLALRAYRAAPTFAERRRYRRRALAFIAAWKRQKARDWAAIRAAGSQP